MLRLNAVSVPLDHTEEDIRRSALSALRVDGSRLRSLRVVRRGVDARGRPPVFILTLEADVADEDQVLPSPHIVKVPDAPAQVPSSSWKGPRPVIVGTGPAGLFAALVLARSGARPILLERGRAMEERIQDVGRFFSDGSLDPASNVQFGEGGAGTFSDGKLHTLIHDALCRRVLREFVACGAPEEILVDAKPHLGTEVIRGVVVKMRRAIQEAGGEVRFQNRVSDLLLDGGRLAGIRVNDSDEIQSPVALLAVGNAARDTFEMLLRRGVALAPKPFSVGVRIEHLRALIDRAQYGPFAGHPRLGAADYKMSRRTSGGRGAYTFCMCPGGVVVAGASEPEGVVTNGMSWSARDAANSNSALMVGVDAKDFGGDDPLAGVTFQRTLERKAFAAGGGGFRAPIQTVGDFLAGRPTKSLGDVSPSYRPGVTPADLRECLPAFVVESLQEAIRAFDRRLQGFAMSGAVLTGVETRSSSPVRVIRDERGQTNIAGLYALGEGAGYAGGIMSSAVDGLRTAEALLAEH